MPVCEPRTSRGAAGTVGRLILLAKDVDDASAVQDPMGTTDFGCRNTRLQSLDGRFVEGWMDSQVLRGLTAACRRKRAELYADHRFANVTWDTRAGKV